MAEEKEKSLAERIEGLIVDGQKVVLGRLDKLEDGQKKLEDGQKKLEDGQKKLGDGQREILEKMKTVHTSLKNEIAVTAVAVKETVKEEIKRVEDKLDAHVRQPAHA